MTESLAGRPALREGGPDESSDAPARRALSPEMRVVVLSCAMLLVSVPAFLATPALGESVKPSGWWLVIVLGAAWAVAELTVFHFEFRREAMTFSLSEVPTAMALAFLAPIPAIASRIVGSALVLLLTRRPPPYKLLFNFSLFVIEGAFAFLIMRKLLELWGGGNSAIVIATVVAMAVTSTVGSVFVSTAISLFEGDLVPRIVGELRTTAWIHVVTSALAGMALALALVSPGLAFLALIPVSALWFVIRAYGSIGQRLRDLHDIHGFAGRVGSSLDIEEIVGMGASETARLVRSDAAAILAVGSDGGLIVRQTGTFRRALPTDLADPRWAPLVRSEGAQLIDHARFVELGLGGDPTLPDMIVAPMNDENGAIGLLVVEGRSGASHRFHSSDVARVQSLTEQLASSLRMGKLHQLMEHEARHDALTGLRNRSSFERLLATRIRRPSDHGIDLVLLLDLDRFKEVNDTLGHHAGDELLVQFSQRVTSRLESDDVLARLAGDEFAILANRATESEMMALANACLEEAGRPVTLDGLEIVVTASVGVAEVRAEDVDATAPLRRADIAMYNAKWQRVGIELYRDEIDRRTPARLSMLGDLRSAVENDMLDVHYQPKLDLASDTIIGAEALVRWTHPVRGLVPPTEFVRVAEDTGLIKQLTDLMLARGIGTLHDFHRRGHYLGLSVNLSTHDLLDRRLPERVQGYLASSGVDPEMLTLEITESSLLIDAPRSRATIGDLHDIGVRMSIDDFGTGYSSLSYLRRLPVRELKIDQSFVATVLVDEQDEVIVRSTIDLGHNLGLEVVAEGVESQEVLDVLRGFGCDVVQGFCISRPLSAEHFVTWLHTTNLASRRRDPLDPDTWRPQADIAGDDVGMAERMRDEDFDLDLES